MKLATGRHLQTLPPRLVVPLLPPSPPRAAHAVPDSGWLERSSSRHAMWKSDGAARRAGSRCRSSSTGPRRPPSACSKPPAPAPPSHGSAAPRLPVISSATCSRKAEVYRRQREGPSTVSCTNDRLHSHESSGIQWGCWLMQRYELMCCVVDRTNSPRKLEIPA